MRRRCVRTRSTSQIRGVDPRLQRTFLCRRQQTRRRVRRPGGKILLRRSQNLRLLRRSRPKLWRRKRQVPHKWLQLLLRRQSLPHPRRPHRRSSRHRRPDGWFRSEVLPVARTRSDSRMSSRARGSRRSSPRARRGESCIGSESARKSTGLRLKHWPESYARPVIPARSRSILDVRHICSM